MNVLALYTLFLKNSMLYVSIEFFFVYAKLLRSSCYADRDTHCTPTVVRIVCRPSYPLCYGRRTTAFMV